MLQTKNLKLVEGFFLNKKVKAIVNIIYHLNYIQKSKSPKRFMNTINLMPYILCICSMSF